MDLQKEREAFEKECRLLCYKGNMVMSNLGSFYNNEQTNWMWQMWLSAKAQAVPDVQQALNDRLLVRSIKEQVESHIAEISVNDLFDKGWFAAMKCIQSNIDMLEAREQSHE